MVARQRAAGAFLSPKVRKQDESYLALLSNWSPFLNLALHVHSSIFALPFIIFADNPTQCSKGLDHENNSTANLLLICLHCSPALPSSHAYQVGRALLAADRREFCRFPDLAYADAPQVW